MADPGVAQEIERAIVAALSRRGVSGNVVVREGMAELHGLGPVVAIELGELASQWSLLPPDMRHGKIEHAADRLRTAVAQALPPPTEPTDVAPLVRKLVGVLLVATMIGSLAWWYLRRERAAAAAGEGTSAAAAEPTGSAISVGDPTARGKGVCDAARRRLYAGATAMDLDPAGWVVDVWLARDSNKAPLSAEPALQGAIDKLAGRLGAAQPATAHWLETGEPTRALLELEDGYVRPFLQAEGRDRFVALVDELADQLDVDYAALFARCSHSNVRDIGAYFRGRDAAGAATALLFAQGLFAEQRIVDKTKLGTNGALAGLLSASARIEAGALEELVRDSGGRMLAREPDAGKPRVGLLFALGGPTRSQQAAKALAKQLRVD
jgi:hypothetical protein